MAINYFHYDRYLSDYFLNSISIRLPMIQHIQVILNMISSKLNQHFRFLSFSFSSGTMKVLNGGNNCLIVLGFIFISWTYLSVLMRGNKNDQI